MTVAADGPAQNASEAGQGFGRPRSSETIYVITADPRTEPKALPTFANPPMRPEGEGPALSLAFYSPVLTGEDVALGKMPQRDTESFLRAIDGAGSRTVHCIIDCAGGEGDSAIAIATALLRHPYRVTARIVGRCSSAAVLIALAADERTIAERGSVLIHRAARICTYGQFEKMRLLSADEKIAISESLNDSDDATVALLMARLGIAEDVARGWMGENRKWSAAEALANGFVSAVEA